MRSFHKPLETANDICEQAVSAFFTVRLHRQGLNRPTGGGKQKKQHKRKYFRTAAGLKGANSHVFSGMWPGEIVH